MLYVPAEENRVEQLTDIQPILKRIETRLGVVNDYDLHFVAPLSIRFSVFPVSTREFPESVKVKVSGPIVDFIRDIRTSDTAARIKEIRLNFFRSHKIQLQQDESSLSQFRRVSCALDGLSPFVPVVVIGMVKHCLDSLSNVSPQEW